MSVQQRPLAPAVQAFDAIAPVFDARFGQWASVEAQRRAVRRQLCREFPAGSRLLELGGGTGVDAIYMARHDRDILLTDGSPSMIGQATANVRSAGLENRVHTRVLAFEDLEEFARSRAIAGEPPFDGIYSNFAALNCVRDLEAVGRGLSALVRPGGAVALVVFGTLCVGEVLVQLARRDVHAAFRRRRSGDVPARLGGRDFTVRYPAPRTIARAFAPDLQLVRTRGIGVLVPPSAAEPAISRWPRVLRALEGADRVLSAPFARLADHVMLVFRRAPA